MGRGRLKTAGDSTGAGFPGPSPGARHEKTPGVRTRGGFSTKRAGEGPAIGVLVELFFFGGAGECLDAGGAALDHGGHVVEVASADFLLVRHEGVALFASGEFGM